MVRVSGLASGMDIDEIVKSMVQSARVPMDTLAQKKTFSEWQRDDYRDVNKQLLELDQLIFNELGMQKSYIKKTVSVSDPNALSVKSVSSTADFSGTISNITLAKAATAVGKLSISDSKGLLDDKEGQVISIQGITKDGKPQETPFTYTIQKDDTFDSVIAKINAGSEVMAFYDDATKQISFTSKNTGEGNITADGSFFDGVKDGEFAYNGGGNAKLTYNGVEITRPSNTFQINGAEFNLKQAVSGPITFSSAADVDAVLGTIVKFVDKYNAILEKISGKTGEAKYRNFQPLTAEQKKEMTEDEVKLWEEKAKSGTLRNDSILNGVLTKMRSSLYTKVDGASAFTQLSEIGITTTKNYREGGKLEINEEKLRKAISENPNGIYELFQKDGAASGEQGLAQRLRADLKTAMADIKEKAGGAGAVNNTYTIGKLLDNYEKRITAFEKKLTTLETRYYTQFTAMEKAISKANSQSTSLSSYFSS